MYISKAGRRSLSWVDNGQRCCLTAKQVSCRASRICTQHALRIEKRQYSGTMRALMQPVCQPPRATREFNWLPIEALTRKRRRFCTRAWRCVCREAKSGLTLSLVARGSAYATRAAQVIHQRARIYIFFSHAASCNLFSQRFEKAGRQA